jgi:serine/threonine protein kinase
LVKLSHPHIVQIYDAVVDDDLCYLVMEYVAGGTLERVCAAGQTAVGRTYLSRSFSSAPGHLISLSRAGIIHRDIKPANILFTATDPRPGRHQDLRFRRRDHRFSPDRTLVLGIGSPAYMSPQQVKEQTLDQRDRYLLPGRRHVSAADRSTAFPGAHQLRHGLPDHQR